MKKTQKTHNAMIPTMPGKGEVAASEKAKSSRILATGKTSTGSKRRGPYSK